MNVLVSITLLFTIFYLCYVIKQGKNPSKGGKIANCKKIWLFYCLYTWFIFIPILLFQGWVSERFYISFILFSLSMWIRAVVEVYMMYVSKNWSPKIGISHDVFTLLLFLWPLVGGVGLVFDVELVFAGSLVLSLILETYYASAFYKIIKDGTKGDAAVWFANNEDRRFKRILFVTTLFNVPLFFTLVLGWWGIANGLWEMKIG